MAAVFHSDVRGRHMLIYIQPLRSVLLVSLSWTYVVWRCSFSGNCVLRGVNMCVLSSLSTLPSSLFSLHISGFPFVSGPHTYRWPNTLSRAHLIVFALGVVSHPDYVCHLTYILFWLRQLDDWRNLASILFSLKINSENLDLAQLNSYVFQMR